MHIGTFINGGKNFVGNLITMLWGKRDFFLKSHFEHFFVTSFFASVFTSHSSCSNRVSEVSKIVLTFL